MKRSYFFITMLYPISIGIVAILIRRITKWPILDPLLVALVIGSVIKSFIGFKSNMIATFRKMPSLFIPVGVIFYGAVNLNFKDLAVIDPDFIFITSLVFLSYVISILFLSNLFGLSEKTGYLIASGSTICGASAIAITSEPIEAEPEEVSMSLVPVFISALIGLFVIFPYVRSYFKFEEHYGVFCGALLQFTGFVKVAASGLSGQAGSFAISVKAARYLGLLFLIPLFASFIKGRFYVPWYLWAFLCSGLIFNFVPGLREPLNVIFKNILTVLWSSAMAAIGLNADFKVLFTRKGLKNFLVSFISFIIAVFTFLAASRVIL